MMNELRKELREELDRVLASKKEFYLKLALESGIIVELDSEDLECLCVYTIPNDENNQNIAIKREQKYDFIDVENLIEKTVSYELRIR